MRCIDDYYWFLGSGHLYAIIGVLIISSLLAIILIRTFYKYKNQNYNKTIKHIQCPNCNSHTENSYIRCPQCHYKLKANCTNCGKLVSTEWDICPYCEKELTINKSNNYKTILK